MAGLAIAALLANSGRTVTLLEAHDTPGGYAHTFSAGAYRFCAQVHYIFGCQPGGTVHSFLEKVGLSDVVRFCPLDPDGYDHVVIGTDRYRIPNGFDRFERRMSERFPDEARGIEAHFHKLRSLNAELQRLPSEWSIPQLLAAPLRTPHVLWSRHETLQRHFDKLGLSPRLQAVLAGQAGDYLLPPEQAPLLLHVALTSAYDRGAWYPARHFSHLVDSIVDNIRAQHGCEVITGAEVSQIGMEDGQAAWAETTDGRRFYAERFISNADPAVTAQLVGTEHFGSRDLHRLDYPYSTSSFTLYLGLEGVDLREHGFGSFNIWRYPHDDINGIYAQQLERRDLSDPWLFLSTPNLHTDAPGLCPPGHQILEVATCCDYDHFHDLANDKRAYRAEKLAVRERILDILDAEFIPGIRDHVRLRLAGTPLTNERFCRSPRGNSYGAALTDGHLRWPRVPYETPINNLWMVNATAGYPSVGGTIGSANQLYGRLTGDPVS